MWECSSGTGRKAMGRELDNSRCSGAKEAPWYHLDSISNTVVGISFAGSLLRTKLATREDWTHFAGEQMCLTDVCNRGQPHCIVFTNLTYCVDYHIGLKIRKYL